MAAPRLDTPPRAAAWRAGLGRGHSWHGALALLAVLVGLASSPSRAAKPGAETPGGRGSTDTLRDLTLTARGGKLFQVEGREIYVYTERCRAASASVPSSASAPVSAASAAPRAEAPAASTAAARATAPTAPSASAASATGARPASVDWLRFADGRVCRVRGIFGVQPLANDRYGVQIAYRERDWYEAVGTDMFLRTRRCMQLTLGEKGVLVVMAADDMRLLFANGGSCEVQAAFSRLKS